MACFSSWRTGFSLGSQLLVKMSRDQFLFVLAIVDELAKIKVAVFFFFLVRSRAWKYGLLRVSVFCYPWNRRKRYCF